MLDINREWDFIIFETHNNKQVNSLTREILFNLQLLLPNVGCGITEMIYSETKRVYLNKLENDDTRLDTTLRK